MRLLFKEGYVSVVCLLSLVCVYLHQNGCDGCSCDCCCNQEQQPVEDILDVPVACTKSLRVCECNPGWNAWGDYSACSATCGGIETRIRTCDCGGSEIESRVCSNCLNGGTHSGGRCHCEDWQFGSCCTCEIHFAFLT